MVVQKSSPFTSHKQQHVDHGSLPNMPYPLGLNANYIDMLLSNFASAQLTNMLGSDEGLGVKQVAKVFMLFSVDEISKCVKSVLHELYKALQDKYQTLFARLVQHAKTARMSPRALLHLITTNWIVSSLRTLTGRQGPCHALSLPVQSTEVACSASSLTTPLEVPFTFANCLVEYLVRNPDRCSYTVEAERTLKVVNLEEVEMTETWCDIRIAYNEEVDIRIQDRCAFVFTQSRDHRHLKDFLGAVGDSNAIDLASVDRFSQLLPDTLDCIKDKIQGWSDAAFARTVVTRSGFVCQLGGDRTLIRTPASIDDGDNDIDCDYPFEINLMLLIKECGCPKLNVVKSFYDYALLLFILSNSNGLNLPKWRSLNVTLNQQLRTGDHLSLFGSANIAVELDQDDRDSLQQSLDLELPHSYNRSIYRLDLLSNDKQRVASQLDIYWALMKQADTNVGRSTARPKVSGSTEAARASNNKVLYFEISANAYVNEVKVACTGAKGNSGGEELVADAAAEVTAGTADGNNSANTVVCKGLQATLAKAFEQFIRDVSSTNVRNVNSIGKVEVYRIVLERTSESVEVDNPQYKSQQQKFKAMQTLQRQARQPSRRSSQQVGKKTQLKRLRSDAATPDDGEASDSTYSGIDTDMDGFKSVDQCPAFSMDDMPTRKLLKTKETVQVVAKHITSVEKTFDTLYLRAADKARLHSVLDLFHTRKDMIKKLSLPLKLGLLLHGLPGTGKTSTINAVASYLQKDIYYVSLKQIRTDNELLMVFQHINKNCSAGGLVVFEEIDLQSSVVVRQEFKHLHASGGGSVTGASVVRQNNSTSNDTDDKPLTLDAILNVLQGSLTSENTCFIATTNHIERLEPALFRSGRFDLCIEMKLADRFQIATIYKQFMGRSLAVELLETLPENHWSPADIIFFLTTKLFSDQDDEAIVKELRQVTPSSQLCAGTENASSRHLSRSTS